MYQDAHCCDPRSFPYAKRDVTNARAKLGHRLTQHDLKLTVEYFKISQKYVEKPNFFEKIVDDDGAVRALFWVDGRTRALYPKYKHCIFCHHFVPNRYNLPFASIVGINTPPHTHSTCVVLCCLTRRSKLSNGSLRSGCWQ